MVAGRRAAVGKADDRAGDDARAGEQLGRQRDHRRLDADARRADFDAQPARGAQVVVGLRRLQDGVVDERDDGHGGAMYPAHVPTVSLALRGLPRIRRDYADDRQTSA